MNSFLVGASRCLCIWAFELDDSGSDWLNGVDFDFRGAIRVVLIC